MTTIIAVKPDTWQAKLAEADKLFSQAKGFLTDKVPEGDKTRAATVEEKGQVEALYKDGQRLKAEAIQLQKIMVAGDDIDLPQILAKSQEGEADNLSRLQAETKARQNGNGAGADQFKTWGEFLRAVWIAQVVPNGKVDRRLNFMKYDDVTENIVREQSKDMAESVGATGGFLVPTQFEPDLQSVMAEQAVIRNRATVIPMRRRSIQIPVLNQTATTAGQPHWFGGMDFSWIEEGGEKPQSDPTFRQIELVAHKLVGYTRANDELLSDAAISLSAFLSGPLGFAGGAVWKEEFAFLQGTGAGQPQGVLNAPATIPEGRNTAGTVVFDDLADMMKDFLPSGQGLWMISQSLMSDIIQLNGPAGNPSFIWQANARDGIPGQILGFPVIWTEKLPTKGSAGDILLADWKFYLIGDRQATTIETTRFDRWAFDQTSWRMVHRVDGQPWLSAPLTLQDGTTQVSPFVILGATAGGS